MYTNIAKPTGTPYTNVTKGGAVTYDEPIIAYDDASTFYDGINLASYSNVGKPTGSAYTNVNKPT